MKEFLKYKTINSNSLSFQDSRLKTQNFCCLPDQSSSWVLNLNLHKIFIVKHKNKLTMNFYPKFNKMLDLFCLKSVSCCLNSKTTKIQNLLEGLLSFIRPHLDYGDIIFDQAFNKSFHNNLELIQYNASLSGINMTQMFSNVYLLYHKL